MLYHYKVGFPQNLKVPDGTYKLKLTNHAKRALIEDRYPIAPMLPGKINTSRCLLVEVETDEKDVVKLVYRIPVHPQLHLVVAGYFFAQEFVVKTVWGQLANDNHSTLDRNKYDTP